MKSHWQQTLQISQMITGPAEIAMRSPCLHPGMQWLPIHIVAYRLFALSPATHAPHRSSVAGNETCWLATHVGACTLLVLRIATAGLGPGSWT